MKLFDRATRWSLDCDTDTGGKPLPGGIVLRNVRHDDHNFATDIRTVGIWVETQVIDPPGTVVSTKKTFYQLDGALFTVSPITILSPPATSMPDNASQRAFLQASDAALSFGRYFKNGTSPAGYGISATYEAPILFLSLPNCEHAGLNLTQFFLFSRYSDLPRHEPSGSIAAARCHPMIRYALVPNTTHDPGRRFTRISSIRFDYRLHLTIDRHHDLLENQLLTKFGNQAGAFADEDNPASLLASAIVFSVVKGSESKGVSRAAFDAVEKPAVLEITAPGLAKGVPIFADPTRSRPGGVPLNVRCWDNLHWWGARGPDEPIISAPGAFHAAHLHWRWGATTGLAQGVRSHPDDLVDPAVWPAGVAPRTAPLGGMWGPLVDPAIWIQSIRFAVTKNDPRLDPNRVALNLLSKEDWKSLFTPGLRQHPQDISAGDDIVLWFSIEVHREVEVHEVPVGGGPPRKSRSFQAKTAGTVFIHGLFFPHDADPEGFTLSLGTTGPEHRPTSEATIRSNQEWYRPPFTLR
ncbi:hypothetical protein [Amycolatopsis vancoresmycina]|uniref:Uncharacterized protein n=1 Tax=Amycolatopsis vancoresmycina DSM 44592 TaxID=1292037 RepID=R1I240_9PSEU|nr:hypothetical protein [Amycolatopsis vancoresmycina]EOD66601.1 hypothetical protein H480_20724 [Amycolatopsis vancoresmycina DSM 44592]